MLGINLDVEPGSALRILCLGAHSDDIEIGCGGTILRLIKDYPNVQVCWVVFGATGNRADEARCSADAFLKDAKVEEIIVESYRDGFFPYIGAEIKDYFEQLKRVRPDLIFTHYRHDLHQDHRLVNELTWNTFRDHLILEYEIPKYDGDLGSPNFFVCLDKRICQKKIDNILQHYESQRAKRWFTEDTFFSMLRLRGVESNALGKYAEAFYARKILQCCRL
jgi:LmbE family N-acetylglucosaminyl deacetylase